jgi:hypothetical protein
VELELAKLMKSKRHVDNVGQTKYSTSLSIEFPDFLILLQRFSRRCFPDANPTAAFRKLLLENVFLLANRRFMLRNAYNIHNKEAKEFISSFQKVLSPIFHYYLDLAEKRRNTALAGKISKMISGNLDLSPNLDRSPPDSKSSKSEPSSSDSTLLAIQRLKSLAKSQRELLGYQEYLQFCIDFKLRSTSLITAVQTAEVYLEVVPYDNDIKGTKGMDFEGFQETLLYISMIAFQQLNTSGSEASLYEVSPLNKLKALFLFLWKAINGNDIAANVRKQAISSSTNVYGSGSFSSAFLEVWQKDGFLDYTSEVPDKRAAGNVIIDEMTSFDFMQETFDDLTLLTVLNNTSKAAAVSDSIGSGVQTDEKSVVLTGAELLKLFKARPDLKEFVAIEIGNL